MQEDHSFLVWACRGGVVSVKSGPFIIQLLPTQARELARVLHEAANAISPDHQPEEISKRDAIANALNRASQLMRESKTITSMSTNMDSESTN